VAFLFAIDIGGTFTDLVVCDLHSGEVAYAKSPTTYGDFTTAMFECIAKTSVDPAQALFVKHGTTLVINALVQRTGAKTALVTTKGFRDVLEIGRGNRTQPFNLRFRRDPTLIPRELRFEVAERMLANGEVHAALDLQEIDRLAEGLLQQGVEAVAIAFVNSYTNPIHEEMAVRRMRERMPEAYVSSSTELSREWFEFERSATVAASAYVGPQTSRCIRKFEGDLRRKQFAGSLLLMGSHGGVLSVERACREPIALVESGPVGGCIGAASFAAKLSVENVIAFDMGGTTAKCALIENTRFSVESIYHVGGFDTGFPIRGNVIDIVEVGAGGGSIASVDEQRRIHVGPRSAGSMPGPVCYGRGGTEPTVTDANLALGRLNAEYFLGGEVRLATDQARSAIARRIAQPLRLSEDSGVVQAACGVVTIANITMADAIKEISIVRGRDPRDFVLFSYGGGGPLHAVVLARELNIPRVIIPPEPGNFSAIGMLLADARLDSVRTFLVDFGDDALERLNGLFESIEQELHGALIREFGARDISFERRAEIRYKGQKHSLRVDLPLQAEVEVLRRTFNEAYAKRYGYSRLEAPLEFVSLVSTAILPITQPTLEQLRRPVSQGKPAKGTRRVYFLDVGDFVPASIYERRELAPGFTAAGPAVIEEYGSTTLVGPRDRFTIGVLGEIRIDCSG
jgi:N-methylhydantoinase A